MDWDYYRMKAMECLTVAKRTREPARRSELLSIAQSFMRLARAVATPDHPPSSAPADDGIESPDRAA